MDTETDQPQIVEVRNAVRRVEEYLEANGTLLMPSKEALSTVGTFQSTDQFLAQSLKSLRQLLTLTELRPDSRVLDFGCGVGRVAIPMSGYLDASGSYLGVDIQGDRIESCQERFCERFPNLEFAHFDLESAKYNPEGDADLTVAARVIPSGDFDLAYLFSVFTHILPEDIEGILRMLFESLKEGGQLYASYFLLTDEVRRSIEAGKTRRTFEHAHGPAYVDRKNIPEHAVAYPEPHILRILESVGFKVENIVRGGWTRTVDTPVTWQDVIICRRP